LVCRKEKLELKIIIIEFLGDSGVGKTSFIQRFCTDTFKDTFSATIGVDLQVKMLNIENRIVALQLWDTVR
jgi:Ras and EF-hand domain-containing protein